MRTEIQSIINHMQNSFYERDHIIKACWAALLSKQHLLLLGVPGTAKSMAINGMCSCVEEATMFEQLVTRFSVPEEIFGPVSMQGIDQDDYRRVTDMKLPTAHVAFMDEIFKANSAILNSMLTIINERKFDNGKQRTPVPLISMFGASNELPQGDGELDALYDRFMLRFDVQSIQEGENFISLLMSEKRKYKPDQTITLEQLHQAQEEVAAVSFERHVAETMLEIKMRLEREGIFASDRRWANIPIVLRAWAWLHGRDQVEKQDLSILCDILWYEPEQRAAVVSVVLSITNPLDLAATKVYDDMRDVYSKWDKMDSASSQETAAKIRKAMERMDETIRTSREDLLGKTKDVRRELASWYQEVIKSMDI